MANTVSKIITDEQLNRIIQIESAGSPEARARTSSAAGLGQFITGTWLGVVKKHRPDLFKEHSSAALASMRVGKATAALQLEMLARFTEDNAISLGNGFTDGDLYLAHFLGIADAKNVFRANPHDLATSHVSKDAAKANASIIPGKTCAQLRAWAQRSMVDRWNAGGRHDWVAKYADKGAAVPDRPVIVTPAQPMPQVPLPEVPLKPTPPLPQAPAPAPAPTPAKKPVVTPKRAGAGIVAGFLAWLSTQGWKLAAAAAIVVVASLIARSVYKKVTAK